MTRQQGPSVLDWLHDELAVVGLVRRLTGIVGGRRQRKIARSSGCYLGNCRRVAYKTGNRLFNILVYRRNQHRRRQRQRAHSRQ